MDFGLGRFLEMFEERFGKRPTTVLLALIGVAIAVFCISLVWERAAWPLYEWVSGNATEEPQTARLIQRALIVAGVAIVAAPVVGFILNRLIRGGIGAVAGWQRETARQSREQREKLEAAKSDLQEIIDRAQKSLDSFVVSARETTAVAKILREADTEFRAYVDKLPSAERRKLMAQYESSIPSLLSELELKAESLTKAGWDPTTPDIDWSS